MRRTRQHNNRIKLYRGDKTTKRHTQTCYIKQVDRYMMVLGTSNLELCRQLALNQKKKTKNKKKRITSELTHVVWIFQWHSGHIYIYILLLLLMSIVYEKRAINANLVSRMNVICVSHNYVMYVVIKMNYQFFQGLSVLIRKKLTNSKLVIDRNYFSFIITISGY